MRGDVPPMCMTPLGRERTKLRAEQEGKITKAGEALNANKRYSFNYNSSRRCCLA